MVCILGLFVLSNAPYLSVVVARRIQGYTHLVKVAFIFASTIVFMSIPLNFSIYCWRCAELWLKLQRHCAGYKKEFTYTIDFILRKVPSMPTDE